MKPFRLLFFTCLILLSKLVSGQVSKTELSELLASKKFVFQATTAIPSADADLYQALRQMGNNSAGTVQLNGLVYDLQIYPDSIFAYLPYFGRSYTSVVDRKELSIRFSSKKFSYSIKEHKKGGWHITIGTQDVKDNYRLNLDISKSGYASLSVRDLYRQPITFYGYIDKISEK